VLEGGPKLRRWYGQSSSVDDAVQNAAAVAEAEPEPDTTDAVLVTESVSVLADGARGAVKGCVHRLGPDTRSSLAQPWSLR
jgi:hypothetical protein